MKTRLEKKDRFWEIDVVGNVVHKCWGSIPSGGERNNKKKFSTEKEAEEFYELEVDKKIQSGYSHTKWVKKKDTEIECDYCGKTKEEGGFWIGASKEPDWTMIEGTGKITCPDCYEKAVGEGKAVIKKLQQPSRPKKAPALGDQIGKLIDFFKECTESPFAEEFINLALEEDILPAVERIEKTR
mgnify:CR=1 FL=1